MDEGLTRGEALVGVVGDAEVGLAEGLEGVGGVVLGVVAGAGAVDGDVEGGVGGDGIDVGDVVGGGDLLGRGVEEVGDGGRGVVERIDGAESEVGNARRSGAVAKVAVGGVVVVVTVELLVGYVALLPLHHCNYNSHHH